LDSGVPALAGMFAAQSKRETRALIKPKAEKEGEPHFCGSLLIHDKSITAAATTATTATAAAAAATTAAAVATAAATTTAAITTTAAATAPAFLGLGFVDSESTAIMFLAVDSGNRRLRFSIAAHFDKTKALASAGVTISDDLSALHGAVRSKELFQSGAIDVVAHITHVQFLAHSSSFIERSLFKGGRETRVLLSRSEKRGQRSGPEGGKRVIKKTAGRKETVA
jgi:hypothetical protein